MMTRAQALVIGGGIAGAAAAARLGRAGRHVVLFERKSGPHDKVCGEFISGEAALYLRGLGIDLKALGAVVVSSVRLHTRGMTATTALPFPALSLSRRVLDEAVLRAASAGGAEIRRGCSVRTLRSNDNGWIVELDDGNKACAPDAFLASGKHDLRGWKRPAGQQGDFVGFKLHWQLSAAQIMALDSFVELFFFPGGYAGLELVERGIANLCLVVRQHHFALHGRRWDRLLAWLKSDFPLLRQRLAGGTPCWERPLAIASIPYGYVQCAGDGIWRLGDQAAVIPSFSGNGISIALHSARLAAELYLAGAASAQFQARLTAELSAQVRRATLVSRMLLHPVGQAIAVTAARLVPNLLRNLAQGTRIPPDRVANVQLVSKGT